MVKGGVTSTARRSLSSSVVMETTSEFSTLSRKQCVEDKEGDWWNDKVHGGKADLSVKGGVTRTASGSKNSDMKADCWSSRSATITKEDMEEVEPPSSTEKEDGFKMCEVEVAATQYASKCTSRKEER